MIRIPDGGRFELRLADGAANPYVLQAALLVAGPTASKQSSWETHINMYIEGHTITNVRCLR
jgi:glutamate---methylamine ligase